MQVRRQKPILTEFLQFELYFFSIRATSQSNTNLNLTLKSPSLNRSSVHWFMRVNFSKEE